MKKDMKIINALQGLQGASLHDVYGMKIVMPILDELPCSFDRRINIDCYDTPFHQSLHHVYIICTKRYDRLIDMIIDIFGEPAPPTKYAYSCYQFSTKQGVKFGGRYGHYPINDYYTTCILYNFDRWKKWMKTLPDSIDLKASTNRHANISTETDKRVKLAISDNLIYENILTIDNPSPVNWRWSI